MKTEPNPTELPLGDRAEAVLVTAAGAETASAEFLKKILGLSDKALRDLAAQGFFPAPIRGQYRLAETISGVCNWLQKRVDKKESLPTFPSMKACAGRTGIPVQFLESAKRGGCPGFSSSGRVDLEKVLTWTFQRSPDGEVNRDWSELYEKFRGLNERLKHAKLSGELLPRSIALECSRQLNQVFFSQLDRQSVEFAQTLAGVDAATIKTRVDDYNANIRNAIATALETLERSATNDIEELRNQEQP